VLQIVSTLQIMSFAFGPTVPWREEVKRPASFAYQLSMLDFKASIAIPAESVFYAKITATLGLMALFSLFAVCGISQSVEAAIYAVQEADCYQSETSRFGPMHLVLGLLHQLRSLARSLLWLCSTICVVPLTQTLAEAMDCSDHGGQATLDAAPAVVCGEYPQFQIFLLCALIGPMYFMALVPFAAVEGDASYVPRSTLYDFKVWKEKNKWKQAARRKATDVHLGILHPRPAEAFNTRSFELIAKVCLPFITTELTEHPLIQMSLVSLVGCLMYVQARRHPPFVDEKFLCLAQHLKLLTMCSMLGGLLTTVLAKFGWHESVVPIFLLAVSTVLTLGSLVRRIVVTPLRRFNTLQIAAESEAAEGSSPQDA